MKTKTMLYLGAGVAGLVAAIVLVRSSSKAAAAVKQGAAAALDAINPASPNNLVNRAVNTVVETGTGTPNSFGTWLAEKLDPTTRAAAAAGLTAPTPASRVSIDLGEYHETATRDDWESVFRSSPPLTIEIVGSSTSWRPGDGLPQLSDLNIP